MTQKEKNAMAREAVEFFAHQQKSDPIIITEPNEEYRALAEQFGVTKESRRESYNAVKPDAAARRRF